MTYDSTNQIYIVTAITNVAIKTAIYNGNTKLFDPSDSIPAGTTFTITLPFLFSGTQTNYSSMNIAVSSVGSVTLSWNPAQFDTITGSATNPHYQYTIGITTKNTSSTALVSNTILPWKMPNISSIIF